MKFEVYKKGREVYCGIHYTAKGTKVIREDSTLTRAIFKIRKGVYIYGYIDRVGKRSTHNIDGYEPFGESSLSEWESYLD